MKSRCEKWGKKSSLHLHTTNNLLKSQKSQVTIFIIIAVLVVVSIGIVFFVRNSLNQPADTTPAVQTGAEDISGFVTKCLKITAENGLVLIGRQGGYYQFSPSGQYVTYIGNDSGTVIPYTSINTFTELGTINVAYYFKDDAKNVPSLQDIESQVSLYIQDNIGNCINGFNIYEQKGYSVTKGTPIATVKTSTLGDKVGVSLKYPVTIKKAGITQSETNYNAEVPVRLGIIITLMNNITDCASDQSPDWVASCYNITVTGPDFFPTNLQYDYNVEILVLTDTTRKLNDTYYDFITAYQLPI